jgi:hypothetical protein
MHLNNHTQSVAIEKETGNTPNKQTRSDQTNITSRRRGI